MSSNKMILCRDINGDVHIISQSELIQRTSVYGVVERESGVLLVRDRTRSDEKWDLPGGGVESNEGLLDALKREIKEETDLDITSEPRKICEFIEYFYDIESQEGWESTRHFYKIITSGTPHIDGNDDDIVNTHFLKQPLSPDEVTSVAREIVRMAANIA